MNTTTDGTGAATMTGQPAARPMRRPADGRMLGGVASGIARYLDADVTLVRVTIAALALFSGAAVALYIAAWLLIPQDGEDQTAAMAWITSRQNRSR